MKEKEVYVECLDEIFNSLGREINLCLPDVGGEQTQSETSEEETRESISMALVLLCKQQIVLSLCKLIMRANIYDGWLESVIESAQAELQLDVSLRKQERLRQDLMAYLSELKERLISCSTENASK